MNSAVLWQTSWKSHGECLRLASGSGKPVERNEQANIEKLGEGVGKQNFKNRETSACNLIVNSFSLSSYQKRV
jgi:hypothetical protein